MKWMLLVIALMLVCKTTALSNRSETPLSDRECLAWAMYNESRGEPVKGQKAILDVIEARAKKKGKTACEVIAEPRQFSGYHRYAVFEIDESALFRYDEVSKLPASLPGYSHFHAVNVKPGWARNMGRRKKIGKHVFYKEKIE